VVVKNITAEDLAALADKLRQEQESRPAWLAARLTLETAKRCGGHLAPEQYLESIRQGASTVLCLAAPLDLPRGLVIADELRTDAAGTCIGSGHLLAIAQGHAGGVAVCVDVRGIVGAVLLAHGANSATLSVARAYAESMAAHELAHALTSPIDPPTTYEIAARVVEASDTRPLAPKVASHCPRWAAMTVALNTRVIAVRSAGELELRRRVASLDLAPYGYDFDTIAEAIGEVPEHLSLREWFAAGSRASVAVAAVCPNEHERGELIAARTTATTSVADTLGV
jgi:hypothetical protein